MHRAPARPAVRRGVVASLVLATLLLPVGFQQAAAAEAGRAVQLVARTPVDVAATQDAFVERRDAELVLAGRPFRFAGANEYYLGLDDNLRDALGAPVYPSHAATDAALDSAAALGVTVIRAHTLGISVGNPRSIEPALGTWNEAAFAPVDYAIAGARARGLRLMIPLTDEWRWYHGGKSTFTRWRGYANDPNTARTAGNDDRQRATEAHFYTDPAVVADFEQYVRHLLTHRNPLTGLRYADDPTIALWETGNELWDAPPAWTDRIARFVKSLAPRQLVADGSAASGMHVAGAALTSPAVDVVGGHFYPRDLAWMQRDAAVAAAHHKAYVIGEYDWRGDVSGWLRAIEADRHVAGAVFWTLLPHLPDGRPEEHGDGYALWMPGVDPATRSADTALAAHAARMRAVPAAPAAGTSAARTPPVLAAGTSGTRQIG